MKSLARPAALPSLLAALDRALAPAGTSALDTSVPIDVWRRALIGPASEFLARPGKELRTTIVRAGWTLGGGDPDDMPERLPLVIELLHAGSLIIDDVEDESKERRGAPALHEVVGVPIAINTGSWMYFWALAELGALELPDARALEAHRLAVTTLVRCHQGQALDLATRIANLDPHEVPAVVAATTRLKTGTLCRFAAELAALAAGADDARRTAIGSFGEAMGNALQMLDDLGSLTSPARREKAYEDLRGGRPTWPWAWVAELGPFAWHRLATMSRGVTAGTGDIDELAAGLVTAIGNTGRARIRAAIERALADLVAAVGPSPVVLRIASELERMEKSYG